MDRRGGAVLQLRNRVLSGRLHRRLKARRAGLHTQAGARQWLPILCVRRKPQQPFKKGTRLADWVHHRTMCTIAPHYMYPPRRPAPSPANPSSMPRPP